MDNLALCASVKFQEEGEKSAGFLKKIVQTRAAKKAIPPLQHPITLETDSSITHLHNSVCSYYQSLYTPDSISYSAIEDLLSNLPPSCGLSPAVLDKLLAPITKEELILQASQCPKKSSPGLDGLLYPILSLLFNHTGV